METETIASAQTTPSTPTPTLHSEEDAAYAAATKKPLTIVTAPHEALTSVAEEVTEINKEIVELAFGMVELLKNTKSGIGLAANQVGVLKRIIVVNVPGKPSQFRREPFSATGECVIMINPKILIESGPMLEETEGCLSHPGVSVKVKRRRFCKVQCIDIFGNIRTIFTDGLLARCLAHEIDHLNGVSITSK